MTDDSPAPRTSRLAITGACAVAAAPVVGVAGWFLGGGPSAQGWDGLGVFLLAAAAALLVAVVGLILSIIALVRIRRRADLGGIVWARVGVYVSAAYVLAAVLFQTLFAY